MPQVPPCLIKERPCFNNKHSNFSVQFYAFSVVGGSVYLYMLIHLSFV